MKHHKILARALTISLLLSISPTAFSDSSGVLAGTASVVDGDTLDIHGQRVRLFGMDAFESSQWCGEGDQRWPCGRRAAMVLAERIGRQTVVCKARGARSYDRIVAQCFIGQEDLGGYMVRQGYALAWTQYSMAYVGDMQQAKEQKRGVWATGFVEPWRYRRERGNDGNVSNQ